MPWVQGADYDVAIHRIKAMLLGTQLYLHHKDHTKKIFLEVDASDVGWGGCTYQMKEAFKGDPKDEARVRISYNVPGMLFNGSVRLGLSMNLNCRSFIGNPWQGFFFLKDSAI